MIKSIDLWRSKSFLKIRELNNRLEKTPNVINVSRKWFRKEIAIVCCYFNHGGYKNILNNYKRFRLEMIKAGVRLLTVELAFKNDPFSLSMFSDVIHLRSNSIMWQKERLLNIGIKRLIEEGYENIGWFDADIIFESDDWVKLIMESLEEHKVCQAFDYVKILGNPRPLGEYRPGSVSYYKEKGVVSHMLVAPGFAWAARAEVLEKCLLYDKSIFGSGDGMILMGMFNNYLEFKKLFLDESYLFKVYNENFLKDLKKWMNKFGSIVKGNVGHINSSIIALYHGTLENRNYYQRHLLSKKHNFDPIKDIESNSDGVFEWATEKVGLHNDLKDYFNGRNEDDNVFIP